MEAIKGKFWINEKNLHDIVFDAYLTFSGKDPGKLEIDKIGSHFDQRIINFLGNAKPFTIHGIINESKITCLKCYATSWIMPRNNKEGEYILLGDKISISINVMIDRLHLECLENDNIDKITFTNEVVTNWLDLTKPYYIKNKNYENLDLYGFEKESKEVICELNEKNISIKFSYWWNTNITFLPSKEYRFTPSSRIEINTDPFKPIKSMLRISKIIMDFIEICMEESKIHDLNYEIENTKSEEDGTIHFIRRDFDKMETFWRSKKIILNELENPEQIIKKWYDVYDEIETAIKLYTGTMRQRITVDLCYVNYVIAFERLHKTFYKEVPLRKKESELKKRLIIFMNSYKEILSNINIFPNILEAEFIESYALECKEKRNEFAHGMSDFWKTEFDFYHNALAMKILCKILILNNIFGMNSEVMHKYLST